MSLAERAELFHRCFGEVKVSPSTILRIYLRHKIRFKNIKRGKREIDFSDPHYKQLFLRMHQLLQEMLQSKTRVVYLDETNDHVQDVQGQGVGPQQRQSQGE